MLLAARLSAAPGPSAQQPSGSPGAPSTDSAKTDVPWLELGKPLQRELAGGESHAYRVSVSENQYVRVVVEQQGVDVVVRTAGPDDKTILEFDEENRPQGNEIAEVVARSSGAHTFKVDAKYKMLPGGRYTIRLDEMRPANEQDLLLQEARELYMAAFKLTIAGDYPQAEAKAQRALEIREKTIGPDHPKIAFNILLLGNIAYYKGDLNRARDLYERGIAMLEKTLGPQHPQVATLLNNLASACQAMDDLPRAEQLHRHALEIRERSFVPDHPDIAQSLNNLANTYKTLGDYVSAEPLYLRAIAINEKALGPSHLNISYPLVNLGDMYVEEAQYDKAEPFLQRALSIREQSLGPDHPAVAMALTPLAESYVGEGDLGKGEELHLRALAIREKKLGPDHPDVGRTFNYLGNIYFLQKNYEKAESFYTRALSVKEAALGPYHPDTLNTVKDLATLYMATGKLDQAVAYQSRALAGHDHNIDLNLAIGSERQKQAYLADLPADVDRAITLHVAMASEDPAARDLAAISILRRKGLVLDATSQNMATLHSHIDSQYRALLDQFNGVTMHLARLVLNGPQRITPSEHQSQIKIAEADREKLEVEISRHSAGFYQVSKPATLAAIQSAIPVHAALLELAAYRPYDPQKRDGPDAYRKPRYVAYIIPHTGEVQWKELGSSDEIDRSIESLRRALRTPQSTNIRRLARELDRKLMEPLRPLLGNASHLLISPDGELSLIPFEALLDEHGTYLIERYSFTYLTSGRDLLRMQVPRTNQTHPVLIADPLFGEPDYVATASAHADAKLLLASNRGSVTTAQNLADFYFAPLTGTAREAHAIQSLFPDAQILTGSRATKRALQSVRAPWILHIATHGFFLEDSVSSDSAAPGIQTRSIQGPSHIDNPLLRSGLAVAGANLNRTGDNSGILTALEASTLNLWGTKLVTLSACDTGVGEVRDREGVYGLRRSFFVAGAETLVMSLWTVSDYTARELMASYYSGLKRGRGRGDALRDAQLAILKRKDRRHPFYWASFIQAGEWANLEGQR